MARSASDLIGLHVNAGTFYYGKTRVVIEEKFGTEAIGEMALDESH